MAAPGNDYLDLLDWRRRVAALWTRWRVEGAHDPGAATEEFRRAKDELFRTHPQSPLPEAERAAFPGLAYFPYDPSWRISARFFLLDGGGGPHAEAVAAAPIALPSSGPGPLAMRRVGQVALEGRLLGHHLAIFWIEGYGGGLFLPLLDRTSGNATYGAGRYLLDTLKSADHGFDHQSGELILDLNMAFHPSCVYDPRWACPLAPPENRLPVAVTAGERLSGEHAA
ncbi:MAG: DUF1684 domain-containing protein [Candidatus Limnocylindrales bacterium]